MGTSSAMLDVLVLGSGVAGLSAVGPAGRGPPALRVGVLTKAELSQSATRWAQGGVAAVLGGDEDSTDLHLADTLAAGAGLCDADAVRVLVDEGPRRVSELIALGAVFDREARRRAWPWHARAGTPPPACSMRAVPRPVRRSSGRWYQPSCGLRRPCWSAGSLST